MNEHKIALLIDSGTDVPMEIVQEKQMFMLPLQIIYQNETYTDKIDITPREVYDRFSEEIPKTSLPSGEVIHRVLDEIKAAGYKQVFAVTISSGLSGTYNAVRLIGNQDPDLNVFVLDTKNIGIAAGLQAIRAAELIEEGIDFEDLIETMTKEVTANRVFFNVATLEYLQKGGRIGLVASLVGNMLKLNPTISCNEDGIYYTVAKTRGRKKSIENMIQLTEKFIGEAKNYRLAIAQGDALEEGLWLKEEMTRRFPKAKKILFGDISPALVVHTGPGLLGLGIQILPE
ncbi:DegV family protein [Enterococcus columbae]|uniref:DegV family EDD protein n=1 Tax=Enterococcus columbae DSM 7374 = ATCC 51263 TaxID=1121865 RepID=S1N563_9ENTE|nr:DegV family protein [Enterococcus columbae]EOT44857.1 DegV family EDD protein [Enterococcus columbae DSM 7374 = ATCC 51263]EOW84150.1 DegV family EDD protein [Enterococcus columbae DSM 7374 = ATCC 51263]